MTITAKNLIQNTAAAVKDIFRQWTAESYRYRTCGARDTEPQWHFEDALRNALLHKSYKAPSSANEWELFSSIASSGKAARQLATFTQKVVAAIEAAQKDVDLIPHFEKHMWRVDLR